MVKIICKAMLLAVMLASAAVGGAQEAVRALAERLLGREARHFEFRCIDAAEDTFFVAPSGDGRRIVIGGNNDISMAVGLNHYLRKEAKVHVSWHVSEPVELPRRWPVPETVEGGRAVVEQRFFLNYCTYGYTMVWWQWPEWERLIDWMALNGVNLPLALTGQESVWQEVWREMGMTDDEVRAYFSGPAHLPWHRMANLDGFGGPLPQEWIDGQRRLQERILERERGLGMKPVLPAFAGHVPARIAELYPQADVKRLAPWCGFEPTCFLNSTDPLFAEIQQRYLAKQEEVYGTDHIYGLDPFNELEPPSWEPDYLTKVSEHIYRSLQQADPTARWLQMSWVFYFKRQQWTPERLKAYLTAVPRDSLVLLDYYCEKTEVWRQTVDSGVDYEGERKRGFYGQPFIWCYLGNFGGNSMLTGNLREIERKLGAALAESDRNLVGVGATLEGLDCSPQTYEYLFASVWGLSSGDFVDQWADMRYGKENETARRAWCLLADSVYQRWTYNSAVSRIVSRPRMERKGRRRGPGYSNDRLLEAVRLLMKRPVRRYSYEYDIVNLLSQWMGNRFTDLSRAFQKAYEAGDTEGMRSVCDAAEGLVEDADLLLCSKAESSFGKWVADARAWGATQDAGDYYETQARTIVTVWGAEELDDYAGRLWGGLLRDYYWLQRWKPFFDGAIQARNEGTEFDEEAFGRQLDGREADYAYRQKGLDSRRSVPGTLRQARKILSKIESGAYDPQRASGGKGRRPSNNR